MKLIVFIIWILMHTLDLTMPCLVEIRWLLLNCWNCLVLSTCCYFTTQFFLIWLSVYEKMMGPLKFCLLQQWNVEKCILYCIMDLPSTKLFTYFVVNPMYTSEPGSVQSVRFEMVCRRQRGFSPEIFRYPARLAPPCGCKMHGSISPCWMKKLGKQS
jgi:hypothetical protein